jgi:hypothetical protein
VLTVAASSASPPSAIGSVRVTPSCVIPANPSGFPWGEDGAPGERVSSPPNPRRFGKLARAFRGRHQGTARRARISVFVPSTVQVAKELCGVHTQSVREVEEFDDVDAPLPHAND